LGSTAKVHRQSASIDYRDSVRRNWADDKDTLKDSVGKHMGWTDLSNKAFPYDHGRPLPLASGQQAINYIAAITRKYPFQLRYSMAMPLWDRFCETWCDTGDEQKSLLAI
jgi:hypothetical protein